MLLGSVLAGCSHEAPSISGLWKWEPVSGDVDSLTHLIDSVRFFHPEKADIDRELAELHNIAQKEIGETRRAILERFYYFKAGKYFHMMMKDSVRSMLTQAREYSDSSRRPYSLHRIRSMESAHIEELGHTQIKNLLLNLDFFTKRGDVILTASSAMVIGNSLGASEVNDKALEYYLFADSLFATIGAERHRSIYKINLAMFYFGMGRIHEADSLLRVLVTEKYIKDDPYYSDIAFRDAYIVTEDVEFLREAYKSALAGNAGNMISLYNSMFADHYFKVYDRTQDRACLDSANKYVQLAEEGLPGVSNHSFRFHILQTAAHNADMRGDKDLCIGYLKTALETIDSIDKYRQPMLTAQSEYGRELELREAQKREIHQKWVSKMLLLIVGIIVAGSGCALWLVRRSSRRRLAMAAYELEQERNRRQLLAVRMAMEETERMAGNLREIVDEVKRNGDMDTGAERAISSVIRNHDIQKKELETINELLERTHPQFVARLKERSPGLTDLQVRLATYISIGMDSRQIGAALNIRPESVRQARWRLRTKLGIPEEAFSDWLRSLNE